MCWSKDLGLAVHRRTNVTRLADETLDFYERIVTFEGLEHNSILGAVIVHSHGVVLALHRDWLSRS